MVNRCYDLISDESYKRDLKAVEDYTKNHDPSYSRSLPFFTTHGASHCEAVEIMIIQLIDKSGINGGKSPLTDLEKFILFCAVWTHDLGMDDENSKDFFAEKKKADKKLEITPELKRELHDESSAYHLNKKFPEIFDLNAPNQKNTFIIQKYRNYVTAINLISKYHRMKNDIDECKKEFDVTNNEKIRARLLAAFLRFGDTLHVDSSRFDRSTFDLLQLGQMDRSSRLHWIKSYIIGNISLEPEDEIIRVNIHIPDQIKNYYRNNDELLRENLKNLESAVTNDIYNDMLNVRKIFKDNKLSVYTEVVPNISYTSGNDQENVKLIEGIISDLGIAFSPNTSKVMEKAIDSINSVCSTEYTHVNDFIHEMEQLIEHLKEIRKQKTSHVGLSKIYEITKTIFDEIMPLARRNSRTNPLTIDEVQQCRQKILEAMADVTRKRSEAMKKIFSDSRDGILEKIDTIILFAYSEMVLNYIEGFSKMHDGWKEKVNIYVLECSGKRRVSINNDIEYNDGLTYSLQLSRRGFTNIFLLPDTSCGSLLNALNGKEKAIERTIVLFGVNGIDAKNGDCVHDSGHLMISIIAKKFNVKVFVISDLFKFGELKGIGKALGEKRKTYWLTAKRSTLNALEHNNIRLINYKEDLIPWEYIDAIVTEKGPITKENFDEMMKTAQ